MTIERSSVPETPSQLSHRNISKKFVRGIALFLCLSISVTAIMLVRSPAAARYWHAHRFCQAKAKKEWDRAAEHLGLLVNKNLLLRLSRHEVEEFLGPPDERGRLAPIVDCWWLEELKYDSRNTFRSGPDRRLFCEFDQSGLCRHAALVDADFARLKNTDAPIILAESGESRPYQELLTLDEGEVLKVLARPFPASRLTYVREHRAELNRMGSGMPLMLMIRWNGEPQLNGAAFGGPDGWLSSLEAPLSLFSVPIEADKELLYQRFSVDIVVRANVPKDDLAEQLPPQINQVLDQPIQLTVREVNRRSGRLILTVRPAVP